jgi:hypothetical protein
MLNKIIYAIVLTLLFILNLNAQTDSRVNFDSVMQKSDAVILEDIIEVKIDDEQSAVYNVKGKVLIKNKAAEKYCKFMLRESHFRSIDDINVILTSLQGEVIKELDSDEIKEVEYSAEDFYNGSNYILFELTHNTFPYILSFEYSVKINTLLIWPGWYPQSKPPTVFSEYKLSINAALKFRYYSKGINTEPSVVKNGNTDVYTWQIKNIPPVADEDFLAPEDETQMYVLFVPSDFITDDHKGNTSSWEQYAGWYRSLTKDRYSLPENARKEIKDLVNDVTDVKEKIKILYKYLQKKNRYVAIEMGLAGWQPQSAEQVYNNRYGDCKDLSTFMVAMLSAAGINSYPALALTRSGGVVNPMYPSNQFNHCIVCVPLEKDTVWLECTATYDEMGEPGYNIEDIYTLVVDAKGGKLVKTPHTKSFQNKWSSTTDASIVFGDLNFNTAITVEGNTKAYLRDNLAVSNSHDDVLFLTNLLDENYSNLNINKYNLSDQNIDGGDYTVTLDGTYKKLLPGDGARLFFNPAIFNRKSADDLPKEEIGKRKFPVYFAYPYLNVDKVQIELPGNYTLEAKPSDQLVENDLISYKTVFDFRDGKLFYSRSFELKKNHIPLSDYPLFYETTKKIIELDKAKFVLKKS